MYVVLYVDVELATQSHIQYSTYNTHLKLLQFRPTLPICLLLMSTNDQVTCLECNAIFLPVTWIVNVCCATYVPCTYVSKRERPRRKKKSFFRSIAQPQLLRTSMRRPTFGIQVKQASTASLDGANKKRSKKQPC